MECYCGRRIVEVDLPEEFPDLAEAWGGKTWWRADDGSALCYANDLSMSEVDRRAKHEPYGEWYAD